MKELVQALRTEKRLNEQIKTFDRSISVDEQTLSEALRIEDELMAMFKPIQKESWLVLFASVTAILCLPLIFGFKMLMVLFTSYIGLWALAIGIGFFALSQVANFFLNSRIKRNIEAVGQAVQYAEDDRVKVIIKEDAKLFMAKKQASVMLIMILAMLGVMVLIMAPMFITVIQSL